MKQLTLAAASLAALPSAVLAHGGHAPAGALHGLAHAAPAALVAAGLAAAILWWRARE